jgi:hypothetical protein
MFNAMLRFAVALLVTVVALAAFYVDFALEFQRTATVHWTLLILNGFTVLAIALLVWDLDLEVPWSGRLGWTACIVAAAWFFGIYLRFRYGVEMVGSRIRPPFVFALSAAWLPFLAWAPYARISWSHRFTVLCVLLIGQGVYPYLYRAAGPNAHGQWIARWRGDTRLDSVEMARARRYGEDQTAPPAPFEDGRRPASSPPAPQTPPGADLVSLVAPDQIGQWQLFVQPDAEAKLAPATPEAPLVVGFGKSGGASPWSVQLSRAPFAVAPDRPGVVKFRVRVPAKRTIEAALTQNHAPWNNLGFSHRIELQPGWNNIQYPIRVDAAESNAKLVFALGGAAAPVEFSDVRISIRPSDAPTPQATPPGPELAQKPPAHTQASAPAQPKAQPSAPEKPPTPAPPKPPASAAVQGPSPADRFTGWSLIAEAGAHATWTFPGAPGENCLRLQIGEPGAPKPWNVKMEKRIESIEAGRNYVVRVRARADRERTVSVDVSSPDAPWPSMGLAKSFQLGTEWRDFEFPFTATAGGRAQFHLNLGGPAAQIDVARIELQSP